MDDHDAIEHLRQEVRRLKRQVKEGPPMNKRQRKKTEKKALNALNDDLRRIAGTRAAKPPRRRPETTRRVTKRESGR